MGTLFFLRYEVRRHLATLVLGLLSLVVLPITHRLISDRAFESEGWNAWGVVLALYLVMPLLVLAMASSGWARERSLSTLEWLYARPLQTGQLFFARAAAIALPALLWSGVALAVHGAGAREIELVLSTVPGLPGPATLLAVQLALALGAGLLASALAPSAEHAFRLSVVLVVAAWLAALGAGRMVSHAVVLVAASRNGDSHFLDHANAAVLLGVAAAMGVGAWLAIGRRSPGAAPRQTITTTAGLALATYAAFLLLLHVPRLGGAEAAHALWLGGDRGVTFAAARGMGGQIASGTMLFSHPVLREGNRARMLRSEFVVRPGPWTRGPWPNPARSVAIVPRYFEGRWTLLDAAGTPRDLALPAGGSAHAIGWSPSGNRFAWLYGKWRPTGSGEESFWTDPYRVVVLERDGSLRFVPVAQELSSATRAAWIDDHALLLTESERREESRHFWSVVSVESTTAAPARELEARQLLTAPALASWSLGPGRLPRLGGRAVALLADGNQPGSFLWVPTVEGQMPMPPPPRPYRLIAIDPSGTTLEPALEVDPRASAGSLGNLDDGSLVWAAPEHPLGGPHWGDGIDTGIHRLDALAGTPQLLCTVPNGRLAQFLGHSGAWAIWDTVIFLDYELWGCNVETGKARRLDEWKAWAHPVAAIGARGIFTPRGWVPLGSG